MKTHDVEEQLGITKQALIYYEKEGLINPIRDKNNYRQYTQNDIEILQVILLLRSFEISIDEIKLVFSEKLSIRSCLNTKQNYLENLNYFCIGRSSFGHDGAWMYSKMNAYSIKLYSRGLNDQEVKDNYNKSVAYHELLK